MVYNRPEVHVLGKASEVVESIGVKADAPTDGPANPEHTASAYDLDE